MNPNALASASYLNPQKWMLIVFDNECFASTGGQCSLASRIDIAKVAEGFHLKTIQTLNAEEFEKSIQKSIEEEGPIVIHAKISQENQKNPFINDDPAVLAYKFSSFLTK